MDNTLTERREKVAFGKKIGKNVRWYLIIVYSLTAVIFLRKVLRGQDPAFTHMVGPDVAVFNWYLNILMLLLVVAVFYGLNTGKKWTYALAEAYAVIGGIGEIIGGYIIYENFDKLPEVMNLLAAERGIRPTPFNPDQYLLLAVALMVFKLLLYLLVGALAHWANTKVEEGNREEALLKLRPKD